VNEVTVFRHFGDKETLARAAFRSLDPIQEVANYQPRIDASDPVLAAEGLCACLLFARNAMREQPLLASPGLRELHHQATMIEDVEEVQMRILSVIRRGLNAAGPALRSEVDQEATALSLFGLIMLSVCSQHKRTLAGPFTRGDAIFQAALRPLLRETST
jgi:AcrR family transcriptional regulator